MGRKRKREIKMKNKKKRTDNNYVSTPHIGAHTQGNMEFGIGDNCEMRNAEFFFVID
jgi:hypothetical protein